MDVASPVVYRISTESTDLRLYLLDESQTTKQYGAEHGSIKQSELGVNMISSEGVQGKKEPREFVGDRNA